MNTQTQKALKMAIGWAVEVYNDDTCPKDLREAADKVQQACKEALAQPAQEPVSKTAERDYNFMRDLAIGTEDILNEMLLAKPVAWTKQSELDKTTTLRNPIVMWKNQYASIENNVPLYTHPAPSWQGLTSKEVEEIEMRSYTLQVSINDYEFSTIAFYEGIEQALKEKNHG